MAATQRGQGPSSFISSSLSRRSFYSDLHYVWQPKLKRKKKKSIEQSTAGPKISNVCTMDSSFFRSVEHWINHIAFPGYWGELSYRKLITQTRFFESTPYPQLSSYFRWKWVWYFHFLLLEKCWHFCIISSFSYFSWSVFDRRLYLVLSELLWLL